jgi:hypothetical protein
MKWLRKGAAATAVVGGIAARRVMAARRRSQDRWVELGARREDGPRWHVVTVHRAPDEVMPRGEISGPLARLGDGVEVHVSPAPDGRGTELAARLRDGEPAPTARLREDDRVDALRAALRQSKQLAETGEVLGPPRPATRRTLTNQPLRFATEHGREGGRL